MPIAYISHHDCELHDMGPAHPECPARLSAINDRMIASGLEMVLRRYDAPLADREALELAHDIAHVERIYAASPEQGLVWLDADTAMNAHSLQAARRAAGAALQAVDLVMAGSEQRAFCAVRPPGHHAEHQRAMGFCLFNNVAIAAAHALEHYGLARVAIVDFDVHHGNGTEQIFLGDERILFCSTFQHPFYPFSGHDCDEPHIVNVPLAAGSGSEEFRAAVTDHWLPRLSAFAPEMIFVSAGFDAHMADDMASLNLVEDDYAWVTRALVKQAESSAGGRLVSCLEGGYDLPSLARSVEAHIRALIGD